jgi:hypothetical protein
MQRGTLLGGIAGVVVGGVVATLLHNYPKDVVTRHRYCQVCATHEETYHEGVILGGRQAHSTGPGLLGSLLRGPTGEHEHRFTQWATVFPTFGVPAESPEVADRIFIIKQIDEDPRMVSGLEQALRSDEQRTVKLIQRVIDPNGGWPLQVLAPLGIQSAQGESMEERWRRVDAAIAAAGK